MSTDLVLSIVGIALVAAAAAFALVPMTRAASDERETFEADRPLTDRAGLYRQMLELEFDHEMGKLSTADFEQLSAWLLAQAGEALREERGAVGAIDEEIEREIAAARAAFAAARRARTHEAETVS